MKARGIGATLGLLALTAFGIEPSLPSLRAHAQAAPSSLRGRVISDDTGLPLANARVQVEMNRLPAPLPSPPITLIGPNAGTPARDVGLVRST